MTRKTVRRSAVAVHGKTINNHGAEEKLIEWLLKLDYATFTLIHRLYRMEENQRRATILSIVDFLVRRDGEMRRQIVEALLSDTPAMATP